jgi:hypothetical protein
LEIKEDASKTMAGAIIVTGTASSLLLGLATNAWSPSKGSSVINRNQVGAVGFDVKKPKASTGNQTYANTQTINGANSGLVESEVSALQRIAANNRAGSSAADLRSAYQQAKGQVDFAHIEADVRLNSAGGLQKAQGGHFSTSPLGAVNI